MTSFLVFKQKGKDKAPQQPHFALHDKKGILVQTTEKIMSLVKTIKRNDFDVSPSCIKYVSI